MRTIENSCRVVESTDLHRLLEGSVSCAKASHSKVYVTTSGKAYPKTKQLANDIVKVIPNSEYLENDSASGLSGIEARCLDPYSHLIVVFDIKKSPQYLSIKVKGSHIYNFRICDYTPRNVFSKREEISVDIPELVLNNFTSKAGRLLGMLFSSLVTPIPNFQARQVLTFHNQRDFIFVRSHRYIFDQDKSKARLQELGPRLSMKLFGISEGWRLDKFVWGYEKTRKAHLKELKKDSMSSLDNKLFFF